MEDLPSKAPFGSLKLANFNFNSIYLLQLQFH